MAPLAQVGEDVFEHPQITNVGYLSVQLFAHLADKRVGAPLAEFDATPERSVKNDVPRWIVAAKDQQAAFMQENAEDDRRESYPHSFSAHSSLNPNVRYCQSAGTRPAAAPRTEPAPAGRPGRRDRHSQRAARRRRVLAAIDRGRVRQLRPHRKAGLAAHLHTPDPAPVLTIRVDRAGNARIGQQIPAMLPYALPKESRGSARHRARRTPRPQPACLPRRP